MFKPQKKPLSSTTSNIPPQVKEGKEVDPGLCLNCGKTFKGKKGLNAHRNRTKNELCRVKSIRKTGALYVGLNCWAQESSTRPCINAVKASQAGTNQEIIEMVEDKLKCVVCWQAVVNNRKLQIRKSTLASA